MVRATLHRFHGARCVANRADARRTVQPMVDSIGKRCNDAAARSRRNPYGTGLGKLLAALRVLSISTYRLRLAPSQKLAEARSRP